LEKLRKNARLARIEQLKSIGKLNADNEDDEPEEADYEWEIECDYSRKYFRRNKKRLYKNAKKDVINNIANHRKRKGDEGQMLVVWMDGIRQWAYITEVQQDFPKLFENYLDFYRLRKITFMGPSDIYSGKIFSINSYCNECN
jgi:hypothetical protein